MRHEEWFAETGPMAGVKGYISPRAAVMISSILTFQRNARITGSLAEIGVYYGKTFVGLVLAANPGETVLGFDLFPADTKAAVTRTVRDMLPPGYKAEVVLVTGDSTSFGAADWISRLKEPARFIHLDGDHRRGSIVSDMLLADSYLADGAVVVIDDFLHDWYPDVTEGVFEALRVARNLRPVAVIPRSGDLMQGGTKLLCTTPSHTKAYTDLVRTTFPQLRAREVPIAGYDAMSLLAGL